MHANANAIAIAETCCVHEALQLVQMCTLESGNKNYQRHMMWHFIASSIENDKGIKVLLQPGHDQTCMLCLIGLRTQVILIFEEVGPWLRNMCCF